jgi:flavin-dependent dehydrogenase
MGTIPTNREETCLFASTTPEAFLQAGRRGMAALFLDTVERMDPALAQRLGAAPGPLVLRGFPGVRGHMRCPVGSGWALVGDAGHFRDPATAHGITDALRDAESLARATVAGSFDDYAGERDAVSIGLFDTTDAIAALDWDLEEVQRLHHQLSQRMNDGVELIRSWDRPGGAVSSAA